MDPLSIAAIGWLMSALVSKAVTSLLEAWAKRTGLGKEFKILKDQLRKLGALLNSARRIETENSFLDELVQDLQNLAYQAENLLDELDYYRLQDEIQQRGTQENVNCSTKPSAASSSSGFRLASRYFLSTWKGMSCRSAPDVLVPIPETFSSRINLSRRMEELVKELQKSEEEVRNAVEIEAIVITAQNTEISHTKASNIPQTSSFHTDHSVVVGRDQERDQLMNLLTNEESAIIGKFLVIAIVGCGGVGKTTLAGLVFNDPNVQSCFDVRSWICVSTHFDIVRFTREMLEGACGNSYDQFTNPEVLQRKLKDKLESNRFLLVLDDMWEDKDKSQWDKMVALFNNCKMKRGIILVTTRNPSVAKMIDARDNINLHGLENDAFLSFFSTCIFNDSNYGGNWRLRKIGQEIANKLKCNPLAAKTVSALLKENLDEGYWMKIRDSEEWKFQSGQNHIMPALRLSYEHMPFHLQRCFSYCAILLEDHPFTCEELVYQWMAQGYLDVRFEGKRVEDIGRAYFNDLFNRGFFQTIQSRHDEVHYTFHDLIHDLAHMVAFKECLTINGPKSRQIPPTIRHLSISPTIRHLPIFTSTERGEEAIVRELTCLKGEHLSTIFNWNEFPSERDTFRSISDLLKETKFLRAMRLTLFLEVQPHNFQNFISLRYLKLMTPWVFKPFQTLPEVICRLYHLEVLQIGRTWSMLPDNFSDLVSLRHFIVEQDWMHSKIQGVGKLTSLQELNHFDVQQKKGFEIEQLGSLKEIGGSLHIWSLENVKSKTEASKARLAEKEKLDALYLHWEHGEQENKSVLEGLKPTTNLKSLTIDGYGGVASPTWLEPSLIFLKSLFLVGCKAWELLPPIGELESLKCLELSELAVREIGPQCYGTRQSMKFPSLEKLKIEKMPDLEKWVWSDQLQQFLCFKKLKELRIRDCPNLVDLPLSGSATSEVLEMFPSLETLIIQRCPLIFQLPHIGELESLKCLKLSELAVREIGPQCYGTHQSMKFPSLEKLKIEKMPDLEKWVWSDQLQQFRGFKKLKELAILDCPNLVDLPLSGSATSEVLERFPSLETIIINKCPLIFQLPPIGELESLKCLELSELAVREIGPQCYGTRQSMKFPSLEELKIEKMPDLEKWVWSDQLQQFLCFKKLKNLTIRDCPNLVDLPLSGSTSEVLDRFPSLETLIINECPLIFQLPLPLPYSSLLSTIYISGTGCINELDLRDNKRVLIVDKSSSLKLDEVLAFHELSSLRYLSISNFSSLESLDLHPFVALRSLDISECQSLTSITFVEHLVSLKDLEITSCKSLRSMKGVKSWGNLYKLEFRECPRFIPAWDSASKEIERTEPDFSLSLTRISGDSLALLTLPICKQLSSLQEFVLGFSSFTEEHEVSPQFLTSLNLVDIRGCKKNLQSFPFDLFPSLKKMRIEFPRIQSLPTSSRIEITDECTKLRNIKEVHFFTRPLQIHFEVSSEEMISQQMDADN